MVECDVNERGVHAKKRLDTSVEAADTSVCATNPKQLLKGNAAAAEASRPPMECGQTFSSWTRSMTVSAAHPLN